MFSHLHVQFSQASQPLIKTQQLSTCKGLSVSYSKKKIGDYAYYLDDLIGSGYSSQVYKCFHRDQPNMAYAIKVINLSKLARANLNLLRDEISILKTLNHPNIIKFHNYYFTENNCYLVTDFCEGGTLQDQIDRRKPLKYEDIFDQLVEGCKYLEDRLIVHRDIKPANVFLKGNQWKIGDFGFARFIEGEKVIIKQPYKVGSPLYMPPETLSNSICSLKTDSFALGVLFFYMITKKFPWVGSNNKQLLQSYKNNAFPSCLLQNVSLKMQRYIESLCKLDLEERILIKQIDSFAVRNPEERSTFQIKRKRISHSLETCIPERSDSTLSINEQQNSENLSMQKLKSKLELDIIQRIKLCKFVHYMIINIKQFDSLGPLRQRLEKLLKLLTVLFEWIGAAAFSKYVSQFNCSEVNGYDKIQDICELRDHLGQIINNLGTQGQNSRLFIARLKLIQLRHILRLMFNKNPIKLKLYVNKFVLHPDFSKIYIQPVQVEEIEKLA